jgi:hypothetical protein
LEDTGVDRIIILQWIGITNRAAYEGMYWIQLVQYRGQCRVRVNMVMDFWFHKKREASSSDERLSVSEEGLHSRYLFYTYSLKLCIQRYYLHSKY